MNPLDWSLWYSIPVGLFVYLIVALGDGLIWSWYRAQVPATHWSGDLVRYTRNDEEKKEYEAREQLMYWAWGWPLKYLFLLGFLLIEKGIVDPINYLLDYTSEQGKKLAEQRLLEDRQKRYDDLGKQLRKSGMSSDRWKLQSIQAERRKLESLGVTPDPTPIPMRKEG